MKRLIIASLLLFLAYSTVFAGSQQTGSTTSTALITRVRYNLNEATAGFWSDAELLSWINNGIEDIAIRTKCLQASENATLASGQIEYTVSSNYIGIVGAYYHNGSTFKALERTAPFDPNKGIGRVHDVDEPVHYADWGGKILVWPEPGSSAAGDTVNICYVEFPSRIIAGGAVPLPAYLHNALEMYTTAKALYKDKLNTRAAWYESRYQNEIDRYRMDYIEFYKEPAQ